MPKPFIKNVATVHDDAENASYVRLRIRTVRGTKETIELPREDISDIKSLKRQLLRIGAVLPSQAKECRDLIMGAVESNSPHLIRRVAQSGWVDGTYRAFATQSRIIGNTSEHFEPPKRAPKTDDHGATKISGSARSWKAAVGVQALLSSSWVFSISAAFAGPLLRMLAEDSFSVCFSAPSRTGKSVVTLVGSSVVGVGSVGEMMTWNVSEAGLEQRLPLFNDYMIGVDDFETMKGSDAAKYERIRGMTYGIAAGTEKVRHSAAKLSCNQWRVILVTSMERTIAELARSTHRARQTGEAVRMIDVPLLSRGKAHIFDLAGSMGEHIDASWREKRFESMVKACAANHGAVFEDYLEKLCDGYVDVPELAGKHRDRFVKRVTAPNDEPITRDVARKFGVVYAAGRLAIKFKLVPWKKEELFSAIENVFCDAKTLLPDRERDLATAQATLKEFVEKLRRRNDIDDYEVEPGYRVSRMGPARFVVKVDAFNALFETDTERRDVLNWLGSSKLIVTSSSSSKPKYQFKWPDGERRRSYTFSLPV
ncbi:DUF927 domain-containing protein [Bradyrhizobium icense]|uniref:DUF927 domain-containing protein n=1 Tax=Bradyrhizobium icense TaxID=1274631 RepID=A0A1B1UBM7_9BRAD|nr:DUF927 domain-containing protein [Bradyrhizobium icense]ANW00076.1 hypothetical protein LMTR13_07655 [Bradyrhizobium icense]